MTTPQIVCLVVTAACGGLLTGAIARYRGYDFWSWFIFGIVLLILALPMAIFGKRPIDPLPKAKGMIALAIVAGLAIPAALVASASLAPAELPLCDGLGVESSIKSTVANSPAGKTSGLEVVYISNIQQISKSASDISCSARAKMNSAVEADLRYRFYLQDGQVFVEVNWSPAASG